MMDYAEKRSLKKVFIFLMPFLIVPFYFLYGNFKTKAIESSVKSLAAAISIGEKSFRDEFKKYSSSLKEIGVDIKLDGITTYTKVDEIPESELQKLTKESYPFFAEDSYQVLMKFDNGGKETFWVSDQTGRVKKIE